jgi:hypothetical protein
MAEAINYALAQWSELTAFLADCGASIGRVENGRSGVSFPVAAWRSFCYAASFRLGMILFPVPACQTGRAGFPHPAFSYPQTFALGRSAWRSEMSYNRDFDTDTRPETDDIRCLGLLSASPTIVGLAAPCNCG